MKPSPLFLIDFYKVDHVQQYRKDIRQIYSNWTPRSTRVEGQKTVVNFGLQYYIKSVLQEKWQKEFFDRGIGSILRDYRALIKNTLGVKRPYTEHIENLHAIGYLPIQIFAIPEGFSVPFGCPAFVITNTHPSAFWLPNFLETSLSNILWKPSTSATTAQRFRKLFIEYAKESGEKDFSFVDWMGHDFSYRGMSGLEDAILSGMGHLLSFSGTDTIPAILAANQYYGASLNSGGSVSATEHSVMCAGCEEGEFETFRRLLVEQYPKGIVSIVSDTWDLWRVLTDYIPRLKKQILARRNGKLVVRPDSGDPVKIICGDLESTNPHAVIGAISLLAKALGVRKQPGALPLIKKGGLIYGDGINYERADQILSKIVREKKLSPYNIVFGIGSFTYEFVTRDTYNFAMKATAFRDANGKIVKIFKKPVTDNFWKKSHFGIPVVYKTQESTDDRPEFFVEETDDPSKLDNCAFEKVFSNGELLVENSFDTIRSRVRA